LGRDIVPGSEYVLKGEAFPEKERSVYKFNFWGLKGEGTWENHISILLLQNVNGGMPYRTGIQEKGDVQKKKGEKSPWGRCSPIISADRMASSQKKGKGVSVKEKNAKANGACLSTLAGGIELPSGGEDQLWEKK